MEYGRAQSFLSIQAQDFIEDSSPRRENATATIFLSIQAQDFIEELEATSVPLPQPNS